MLDILKYCILILIVLALTILGIAGVTLSLQSDLSFSLRLVGAVLAFMFIYRPVVKYWWEIVWEMFFDEAE